jgi:hypothetical protein
MADCFLMTKECFLMTKETSTPGTVFHLNRKSYGREAVDSTANQLMSKRIPVSVIGETLWEEGLPRMLHSRIINWPYLVFTYILFDPYCIFKN